MHTEFRLFAIVGSEFSTVQGFETDGDTCDFHSIAVPHVTVSDVPITR